MHEFSVTQSILDIALRHAEQAGAAKITDLFIVIGDLSSIVDDSVQFYWEIVGKGTIAEGSELHFKRIPAKMLCLDCDIEYQPDRGELVCPNCQGFNVKVIAGEEFTMEAIEIEK